MQVEIQPVFAKELAIHKIKWAYASDC